MKTVIALSLLLLIACMPSVQEPACSHPVRTIGANVICVIDGDTVRLADGTSVRLIGIDTPERGKAGYANATAHLITLINNTDIRLERDTSETDTFGRQLRYLYANDVFVNEELVKSGWAVAKDYPPDIAHATLFHAVQDKANASGLGLWQSR